MLNGSQFRMMVECVDFRVSQNSNPRSTWPWTCYLTSLWLISSSKYRQLLPGVSMKMTWVILRRAQCCLGTWLVFNRYWISINVSMSMWTSPVERFPAPGRTLPSWESMTTFSKLISNTQENCKQGQPGQTFPDACFCKSPSKKQCLHC